MCTAMKTSVVVLLVLGSAAESAPFEVNTLHGGAMSKFSKTDDQTYGTTFVKQRPVSKVMDMLKDMQATLAKEAEEDQEVFDQFACWCETNEKSKTKAIADGEQKIKTLGSQIENLAATSTQLASELSTLSTTIAKGEHALSEATAVRDKELAEFNQQDKDAVVAITGLRGAVETLSKHNAGAVLSQEAMLQVRQVLSLHMSAAQLRKLGLAPKERRAVAAFIQQPTGASSYNSNSGEIFGVLGSMKESFEANLESSRKEEETAAAEFANLKAAKTTELAAANKQEDSKSAEKAQADEDHANAKTDLKDTTAQLEADTAFLADLKTKCATMDKDWADRTKMRQDENTALSQALEILSDDDARDTMVKTTGFLQVSARTAGGAAAAKILTAAAGRLHRPKLAMLAMKLKGGVFDKAIENVKDMIAQLHKQKQEEVKHKDYCIEELHQSDMATDELYHGKSNLETKQADLLSEIQRLTDSIASSKEQIADMQIQMKKASEVRATESKDFTVAVAEQRDMQAILGKAVAKLRAFYDRKSALLQSSAVKSGQPAPPAFKPYKKGGGGMVIATMEHLIHDSHSVQTQSISMNTQSQLAYEEFMRELNKSIILLRTQIADETEQRATADADLARTKADLLQNMKDLEAQDTINNAVHKDCDFLMKEFDRRQAALDDEVDALYEAVSMMSQGGEKPPAASAL